MTLEIAYFPPIEYFAVLARYSSVYVNASGNYQKQSYRNRCRILGSNGPLDLRFPIVHDACREITRVKVDYSTPWLRQSKYAIDSAYYSSPFFEYYRDSLFEILDRKPETLWELDMLLIRYFCSKIGLREPLPCTNPSEESLDIHPKHPSEYRCREYCQVFSQKTGFVPNLSVMDLLFNEGPESICYL